MAFMTLNFESRYLRTNQSVNVVLPDMPRDQNPRDF